MVDSTVPACERAKSDVNRNGQSCFFVREQPVEKVKLS